MRLRIYLAWLAAWLFAWCAFCQPMPPEVQPSAPKGRAVTLAWDAPAVNAGLQYRLRWMRSGSECASYILCGTNLVALADGLPAQEDVRFVVTALDGELESDPSNEVLLARRVLRTNLVVRISGTNMHTAPTPAGPWTYFGSGTVSLTNPTARTFYRGATVERWLE